MGPGAGIGNKEIWKITVSGVLAIHGAIHSVQSGMYKGCCQAQWPATKTDSVLSRSQNSVRSLIYAGSREGRESVLPVWKSQPWSWVWLAFVKL